MANLRRKVGKKSRNRETERWGGPHRDLARNDKIREKKTFFVGFRLEGKVENCRREKTEVRFRYRPLRSEEKEEEIGSMTIGQSSANTNTLTGAKVAETNTQLPFRAKFFFSNPEQH